MWNSSASQAFENDPTLKDILAATYTSSRRINYAVCNGVDMSTLTILEELLQQSFNLLLIGDDSKVLEQVKAELLDSIAPENEDEAEQAPNLTIDYICIASGDWVKPDTHKSIEDTINDLDFPCLLMNNYRFYSKTNAVPPPTGALGISGIGSPSFILYQSMMKTVPLTTLEEIVGRAFYSMQKARCIDLSDKTDPSNYQALDSLVLNKTNSSKKQAMKKLAVLNIKEHFAQEPTIEKTQSERKFLEEHPEFFENNDDQDDEEAKNAKSENQEEYKVVV